MYLLYNTNFLVQRIKNYNTLEDSLRELQIDTISRTLDYNNKIYVIQENEQNIIYTSDGEHIYLINLTDGKKTNIFTNKKINYNGHKYWQQYCLPNTLITNSEQNSSNTMGSKKNFNNDKISDNMNIIIGEKKSKNIIFEDNNTSFIIKNIVDEQSIPNNKTYNQNDNNDNNDDKDKDKDKDNDVEKE